MSLIASGVLVICAFVSDRMGNVVAPVIGLGPPFAYGPSLVLIPVLVVSPCLGLCEPGRRRSWGTAVVPALVLAILVGRLAVLGLLNRSGERSCLVPDLQTEFMIQEAVDRGDFLVLNGKSWSALVPGKGAAESGSSDSRGRGLCAVLRQPVACGNSLLSAACKPRQLRRSPGTLGPGGAVKVLSAIGKKLTSWVLMIRPQDASSAAYFEVARWAQTRRSRETIMRLRVVSNWDPRALELREIQRLIERTIMAIVRGSGLSIEAVDIEAGERLQVSEAFAPSSLAQRALSAERGIGILLWILPSGRSLFCGQVTNLTSKLCGSYPKANVTRSHGLQRRGAPAPSEGAFTRPRRGLAPWGNWSRRRSSLPAERRVSIRAALKLVHGCGRSAWQLDHVGSPSRFVDCPGDSWATSSSLG